MANIKLKNLIKEMQIGGGMVSRSPWVKEEEEKPQINVKELVSKINAFNSIGESIYGKGNLKEVAENLSSIAEGAAQHTLSEAGDMFDKITVSRNMKELTNLSKQFGKVAGEANSLQERMSGLYEDMGNILGRYYEIGEKHIPGHDSDDIETVDIEENAYEKFFQGAMKKFGISSPDELEDDKKKAFFNYVDKNYKADNETD